MKLSSQILLSLTLLPLLLGCTPLSTQDDPGPGLASTISQHCYSNGLYPDASCTPGATFPNVTAEDVCKPGYSRSVRDVSNAEKRQVYDIYGVKSRSSGEFEVDHLVSLELGGSNDIKNLWPEPANPRPGFHEKDQVENYLHSQVCSGNMSLEDAQQLIATDWLSVYNQLHPPVS